MKEEQWFEEVEKWLETHPHPTSGECYKKLQDLLNQLDKQSRLSNKNRNESRF